MSVFQAIVLGLVQGATEFLPISSSGHLVLVPWLLGWQFDPREAFIFNVLVQWGTILAVIAYFFRDLVAILRAVVRGILRGKPLEDPQAREGWLVLLASLPAAVLGLWLKSAVERAFDSPPAVMGFLLGTAAILRLSERLSRPGKTSLELTASDAIWIGLAQTLALFPGISRSGATIAGGLFRSLTRAEAARFSFLLAIPAMIGAGLIALLDLAALDSAPQQALPLLAGFLAAALVGWASIHWLLGYLRRRRLYLFSLYCAIVGGGGLLLYVLRP